MKRYFTQIGEAFSTLWKGLRLTLRYLTEARFSRTPIGISDPDYFKLDRGIVTLQYPHESLPVPETGRYRLHNEIDDCIVCDKCAKVCPVDCIEIEPIKALEPIGVTSDGTPKRIYAAKFDIDMAKCCFCGLCTTVCPTECLTMTKTYDFSVTDVRDHTYAFAEMSLADIALKRQELAESEAKKEASKAAAPASAPVGPASGAPKPVFRPKIMPKAPTPAPPGEEPESKPKPVFRPKPVVKRKDDSNDSGS